MPPQSILFWKGFLAGCGQGNGITSADYWYLMGLLPPLDNDPSMDIMLGLDELPDEAAIRELEPLTIAQSPGGGPVPITKPRFVDGKLDTNDA